MLRTALGLSAALRVPFRMTNIRARRPKPGLQTQHLKAVELMRDLTDAEVSGAALGSKELYFRPRRAASGRVRLEAGTAASLSLMIQPLFLAAVDGGPAEVALRGGTDVPMAPTSDYVRFVEVPILGQVGLESSFEVLRRGYYPTGGGEVRVVVQKMNPRPIVLQRGQRPTYVGVRSVVSSLPESVAVRQASAAASQIEAELGVKADVVTALEPGGTGTSVLAFAKDGTSVLGGDALGRKGKPAEVVGREAAQGLLAALRGASAVDQHMADMLLPFLPFCGGSYTIPERTAHAVSNAYVVARFLGKEVEFRELRSGQQAFYEVCYAGKASFLRRAKGGQSCPRKGS